MPYRQVHIHNAMHNVMHNVMHDTMHDVMHSAMVQLYVEHVPVSLCGFVAA